jgi:hypothetical protein
MNVDAVQYEFWDGVRDVLLESVRTSETVNVLNEVSQFVAERLGLSIDQFTAVLRNPQQVENPDLVRNARPFAFVTAHILRQLGNEYIPFAEDLEEQFKYSELHNFSQTDIALSDQPSGKRVALLIGISEYEGEAPLPIQNNISAMQRILQNPDIGSFDEIQVLANPDLFRMNSAIEKLFSKRRNADDLILFYFAGRGIKDASGNFHFPTLITRFNQGQLVTGTTLPGNDLYRYIDQSSSRNQIIILDCSYSGAVGNYTTKNHDIVNREISGGESGHVLMTSSGAMEHSLFDADAELSIYTKFIVEGLETGAASIDNAPSITVDDLHEYVKRQIAVKRPDLDMMPKLFVLKDKGYKLQIANNIAYSQINSSLTIDFMDTNLDDDRQEALTQEIYQDMAKLPGVSVTRVEDIPGQSRRRASGKSLWGLLQATITLDNMKTLMGFLSDRLSNKSIKITVRLPDGREIKIEASSRAELLDAVDSINRLTK